MLVGAHQFKENLSETCRRISAACDEAGRESSEVRLLPVTKNHPALAACYAWEAGLLAVGENRAREALGKMDEVDSRLCWELIGPLQSNKARRVAERFGRVQTVDREKIAAALDRHAGEFSRVLPVLLQVNAGEDPAKSGALPAEAAPLLEYALKCGNLRVEGLMTIAPLSEDPDVARRCFARLRELRDQLSASFACSLPELSMGMSGDLRAAVLEGSTMVRVGTALYGRRDY